VAECGRPVRVDRPCNIRQSGSGWPVGVEQLAEGGRDLGQGRLVEANQPTTPRQLSTWLSPRDTVELVYRCLVAPDVGFTVLYGASANERGWWDLSSAKRLGYRPANNAERWTSQLEPTPTDPAESAEGPQGGGLARA
jgi:hypothetical protein